jgi:maleylpyruvate isomerase
VITHIARNADAMRGMAEAALEGRAVPMYPGGPEQRDEDIRAGSGRPIADLILDVDTSGRALEAAWASLPDEAWAEALGYRRAGPTTLADFTFIRWREVAIHLIDLDIPGTDATQWLELDPEYVDEEWRRTTAGLATRVPERYTLVLAPGDRSSRAFGTGSSIVVAREPVPALLAWLTGRGPGPIELQPW